MIQSGRALLTCLGFAVSVAVFAPQGADAAVRHRRVHHHPAHVVAAAHHRPVRHVSRMAHSGGDTVRIIRAHPRRTAAAGPQVVTGS